MKPWKIISLHSIYFWVIIIIILAVPQCSDGSVTCFFTIDNVVDLATYNGMTLAIAGNENLANWSIKKSVTFESCDDGSPGTLAIKGSDSGDGGISIHFLFMFLHKKVSKVYWRVFSLIKRIRF